MSLTHPTTSRTAIFHPDLRIFCNTAYFQEWNDTHLQLLRSCILCSNAVLVEQEACGTFQLQFVNHDDWFGTWRELLNETFICHS